MVLMQQNRIDEALCSLEKAAEHAKQFDIYLDKLRKDGEYRYTSTFTDSLKDLTTDVHAVKMLPELLNITLLDENDIFYKTLNGDPRFDSLIKRIENEIKD